jgi:hypothetical protein
MADYKERFQTWQKQAKEKFEEIDKQFGLKDKFEEGTKVILDTAQKGAEVVTDAAGKGVEAVKDGVDKIKSEAEKTDVGKQAVRVAEDTFKTAEQTAKTVYEASEPIRGVAEEAAKNAGGVAKEAGKKAGEVLFVATEKAGEVFEDASESFKKTTKTASDLFGFGSGVGKTLDSAYKTLSKTFGWVQEKPLQAAASGVSLVVGAGLGVGFTLVSSNWLFHSALPAWGVKAVSDQFTGYLKTQEELVGKGELSEAEAEKIQFEKDIVKYVGAPLLGAFSCAAGAMMWLQIFNPKTITGVPISWLLGGNPLLEGVWLFGNGTLCLKVGVEFFMVSLDDNEDVQKMVREIKGLLPQAA